jgi:autotransporter-associated beta strand protein
MDVSGTGSISVTRGRVRLAHATYTGTTTVSSGEVQIGGWVRGFGQSSDFVVGSTANQGDYLIRPDSASGNASLTGTGTIGLAPGHKITVENGGVIDSTYDALGPVATKLTINGGLRIGDLGRVFSFSPGPGDADAIDVNGVLDLTGTGDSLEFGGIFIRPGVVVVAEYDTRLGEFDHFGYSLSTAGVPIPVPLTATLSYTSAPNAGPGQVIITIVPEPATSAAWLLLSVPLLKRRRASGPLSLVLRGEG